MSIATSSIATQAPAPFLPLHWTLQNRRCELRDLVTRSMDRGAFVYMEGTQRTEYFLIVEGTVGIYKSLPDGRRQIVSFAFPGDLIGSGHLPSHNESAIAVSTVCVRPVSLISIRDRLCSNPEFISDLLSMTEAELSRTRQQLLALGRQSGIEKMASFLIMLSSVRSNTTPTQGNSSIPMQRIDIADYLGLSIETVSRLFSRLSADGVIEMPGCHEFKVLNLQALQAYASGTHCQSGKTTSVQS